MTFFFESVGPALKRLIWAPVSLLSRGSRGVPQGSLSLCQIFSQPILRFTVIRFSTQILATVSGGFAECV